LATGKYLALEWSYKAAGAAGHVRSRYIDWKTLVVRIPAE